MTTGGSSLRAVASLKEAGYEVVAVIALVDREGALEAFMGAGVSFCSVMTRTYLVGPSGGRNA